MKYEEVNPPLDDALSEEIASLVQEVESSGLRLRISRMDRLTINLDLIERRSAPKGSGASAMRRLCDIADRHRTTITTYAHEADPDLIDYYMQFDFKEDRKAGDEAALIRRPKRTKKMG